MDVTQLPYMGLPTFLRSPLVTTPSSADVTFVGVPYDLGGSNKPGSRYGPRAIREASMMYAYQTKGASFQGIYDVDLDTMLLSGKKIVDAGDIETFPADRVKSMQCITDRLTELRKTNSLLAVIGGDHSIAYPSVSTLTERLTVVHIDAHTDFMTYDAEDYCAHGVVMRKISDLEQVGKIIHCGVRGLLNSPMGVRETRSQGNIIITSHQIHSESIDAIRRVLTEDQTYYVSFDIDALDPSIAPGTGTPEPGGLTYAQTRDILYAVTQAGKVAGIDLVEVNPTLDASGTTALHAARLLIDFLGGCVK